MQITSARLQAILDARQSETENLEFKSQLPGQSDGERKAFCKAVTGLANGTGGHIVYGLADPSAGTAAPRIQQWDERTEMTLRQVLDGGVDPRVPGVEFVPVQLGDDLYVVVYVPGSLLAPHMVTLKGSQSFYIRSGPRTVPMDMTQIRQSVLAQHTLRERLRMFTEQRARAIRDGIDFNLTLAKGPYLVLHLTPTAVWDGRSVIDPVLARNYRPLASPMFGRGGATHVRFNADGLLSWDVVDGGVAGYLLAFREGVVEAAMSLKLFVDGEFFRGIDNIEREIVDTTLRTIKLLDSLAISSTPLAVCAQFLHVKGLTIVSGGFRGIVPNGAFDRDHLRLPEILLEASPTGRRECAATLRPLFDAIYQAGGHEGSPLFDEQGVPRVDIWGKA
jgi:hypothetical protein